MTAAVVVGGASGIGAAAAALHRARGHDVVVWDLDAAADVRCDISDAEQVDAATAATVARVGPPDLVTITAGIGHGAMLLDAPAEDWDRVVGTNGKGVWLTMRALEARVAVRSDQVGSDRVTSGSGTARVRGGWSAEVVVLVVVVRSPCR